MTPADQLREEHQGIILMLRILEKVASKLEAKESVDPTHLEQIVEFFRVFADKCHHGKEEDLLFPALEKAGIPKDQGPIGVLLAEHQQGRGYLRGMAEAVDRQKKGNPKALPAYAENARNYIALLTQHIKKENNVLFPMGEKVLSKEIQEELVEGFEKIETERIGPGTHEELHKLLGHLEKIYLN
jgi:hemerythrin-like domain-containing protein